MIIDAHTHIWDETYASKEYLEEALSHRKRVGDVDPAATKHWMPLPREAWVAELKEAGIEKAIVLAFDLTRVFKTKIPDDFVADYVKEYPDFLVGYGSAEPLDDVGKFKKSVLDDVEKAVNEYGFKGLKLYPWYGNYSADDKALYPLYEKCLELKIPVLLHVSPENLPKAYLQYGTPLPLDNVATDFPGLKIGIAHFGSPWMTECCLLMQKHPNIYVDISETFYRPTQLTWGLIMAKEYRVLNRILFGTDGPGLGRPVKKTVNWLKTDLNRLSRGSGWPTFDQDEINGILGANAARILPL